MIFQPCVALVIWELFWTSCVLGVGQIALRLTEYHHSSGQLLTKDCCDGVQGGTCRPMSCDPYFVITITEPNLKTQNIDLRYQTSSMSNVGSVVFGNPVGNASNPFKGSFKLWPGAAEIAVEIMDNNSDIGIADGLITKVKAIYTAHPQTDGSIFLPLTFNPDNTIIKAEMNVHCDADYSYDLFCYKFCHPTDNATGHYDCDHNGDRRCLPGWSGDARRGCPVGSCSPSPCQHGGNCSLAAGSARCTCLPGFQGRHCEIDLSATTSATSLNVLSGTSSTTELPVAAIAGAVGGLLALGLICFLIYLLIRKKTKQRVESGQGRSNGPEKERGIAGPQDRKWATRVVRVKPPAASVVSNSSHN